MTFVAGSLAGKPVRRVEDADLLRGLATYVDNLKIDDMLSLAFVRSPSAHAEIRSIDISEAERMPGVVAVYTAENLELPDFVGFFQVHPGVHRQPLASGRVRFVGDPVAVVVAESKSQAVDAAELVAVEYETLAAAIDMEAALAPGAPQQYEEVPGNLLSGTRDPGSVDALRGADVVVRGRFENQRVAVVPMEGSAIAVLPGREGSEFKLTAYVACQMPHMTQGQLADALGIPTAEIRVIAPHVGGAFGAKHLTAEGIVAAKAALELGRPVKWVETRSENMVAMAHGRGQVQYVELGLKRDGTVVGMHCRIVGDSGSYAGFGGMLPGMMTRIMASGCYRIPKIAFDVAVAITNTTSMGAYRGAGRPEAAAFVERIMDMAADELGIDPAELRRRNLLRPDEFPYATVMGAVYDSGDYEATLAEALRIARYDDLRAEQAERRRRGDRLQLGIGMSVYVEITGSGGEEFASVEVHGDGTVTVKAGTSAHGQGHATAFSMMVADRLGIAMENIRFVQSDTAQVRRGGGTGGSRSLQMGGSAVSESAALVLERARELAAEMFESAPEDIVLSRGTVHRGRRAEQSARMARDLAGGFREGRTPSRGARLAPGGFHLPVRRSRVGGRGGHGDRGGQADPPHRRRRLRADPQPAPRRRPGARRPGVGHLAGALGAVRLRRRRQPAHLDAGRLRDTERSGAALLRARPHRDPVASQLDRGEGNRRVRNGRLDTGRAERRRRCLEPLGRAAPRHALHARARLAGHPRRRITRLGIALERAAGGVRHAPRETGGGRPAATTPRRSTCSLRHMTTEWTAATVERTEPERIAGERESLEQWLDFHRATLMTKCAGLTSDQLKARSVPPSALSLLGLVRHMTDVERGWFRMHAGGEQIEYLYSTDDNVNGDFDDLDDADPAADLETYRREIEAARAAARGKDLSDVVPSRGHHPERTRDVRWIYQHMIEEYARHNGHADLLRECVDGVTGD